MKKFILLTMFLMVLTWQIHAQKTVSDTDKTAIIQTALDYIEGWYEGDAARMERALHPDLAKRIVRTNDQGQSQLQQMSAMGLVQGVKRGVRGNLCEERRLQEGIRGDARDPRRGLSVVPARRAHVRHVHDDPAAQGAGVIRPTPRPTVGR